MYSTFRTYYSKTISQAGSQGRSEEYTATVGVGAALRSSLAAVDSALDALTQRSALELALASCKPCEYGNSNKDELEQLMNFITARMTTMIEMLQQRSVSSGTLPGDVLIQKAKEYVDLALIGRDVYTTMLLESYFGEKSRQCWLYTVNACDCMLPSLDSLVS